RAVVRERHARAEQPDGAAREPGSGQVLAAHEVAHAHARPAVVVLEPREHAAVGAAPEILEVVFRRLDPLALAARERLEGDAAELPPFVAEEIEAGAVARPR